jgi:blocked-early-in-transport protein 1
VNRDSRATRSQLFDSLEEGGLRSAPPYASGAEIAEQENERGLGELHDRVNILKRVSKTSIRSRFSNISIVR